MLKMELIGTGAYLPELIVTNEMMSEIVETNDEWITSRTGISQRHLSTGEPTWYMATEAARQALAAANIEADEIGLIIATTATPDYFFPSVASIVQDELKAKNAFCFDLNAACTGFVYAVDLAARYLGTAMVQNILIVSAESVSKITDYSDRSTCVLFGDGAGAAIYSSGRSAKISKGTATNKDLEISSEDKAARAADSGLLASYLGTKGEGGKYLVSQAMSINHPFLANDKVWQDRFGHTKGHDLTMDGHEVYRFAVNAITESVQKAVQEAEVDLTAIKYVVPHQANSRIVDAAARRLKLRPEQMVSRVADFANTSSASIPLCLDELVRAGKLQKGDLYVICGFGAGLTYGASVLRY